MNARGAERLSSRPVSILGRRKQHGVSRKDAQADRRADRKNVQRPFAAVKHLPRRQLDRIQIFRPFKLPSDDMGIARFVRHHMNIIRANHHYDIGAIREPFQIGKLSDFSADPFSTRHAGQKVRMPDEIGDERRGRRVIDDFRDIELLQATVIQDRDPIRHCKRLIVIMCDENSRGFCSFEQIMEILAHPGRHIGVQVAERLIKQEQHGLGSKGAGQCHPLLLATRQFVRISALEPGQSDQLQQIFDHGVPLRAGHATQSKGNVVADAEMRKQRVLLKHHADMPLFGRNEYVW